MQKRTKFVIDGQGRKVAGATIRVTEYPGGAVPTIYSDDGVTPTANPLTSDANGRYEYYAANGHYTEVITTNLGAQPAINDILFDDTIARFPQFAAATGTGDAMVVAAFAAGYTLTDGDELRVRAPGANTVTNPTIALPGVGTLTIYRAGGRPLAKYDIKGSGHELHLRYRSSPARMELVNVGRVDFINVKLDFGAKGDGTTNDTAAFNAALALGRPVYAPAGNYLLNALSQDTNPNPRIFGEGRHTVLTFDTTGDGLSFDPGSAQQQRTLHLSDLAFDNVNNVPASFIKTTDHLRALYERLYFSNCAATRMIDHLSSYGPTFRDCIFSDITGDGIRLNSDGVTEISEEAVIDGCEFTRLSGTAIEAECGGNLLITGNTIIQSCGAGLKLRSTAPSLQAWNVTIQNGYFESNTGNDIDAPSDTSFWCTINLVSTSFVGTPTIALGAKSKLNVINCHASGGNNVTVTGSASAEVYLLNSTNFVQSGTFTWLDLDDLAPYAANSSYTPVWTASGVAPVLGDGTLTGRYTRIGKLVFLTIYFVPGATTTFGTGSYRFSLPFPAAAFSNHIVWGSGRIIDSGTDSFHAAPFIQSSGTTLGIQIPESSMANVTETVPMTWVATDIMELAIVYTAA